MGRVTSRSQRFQMPQHPTWLDWLVLLGLSILWAGSFTLIKWALISFSPAAITASRTAIAAGVLLMVLMIKGKRLPPVWPRPDPFWGWVVAMGGFGCTLPFTLLNSSEQVISSGMAAILNATTPMFVAIVAPYFLRGEHWTLPKAIGISVGFAGVAILVGVEIFQQLGGPRLWAQLMVLVVAVSYAINSMLTRRMPRMDPWLVATGTSLAAAIMSLPLFVVFPVFTGPVVPEALAAVMALGLGATALGSVSLIWLISRTSALFATTVNYIIPFWAVAFGAWFLGEQLPGRAFGALALILLGIAISQWRLRRDRPGTSYGPMAPGPLPGRVHGGSPDEQTRRPD